MLCSKLLVRQQTLQLCYVGRICEAFLAEVALQLSGLAMAVVTHASLGQELLHRFAELCAECSTGEKQPKLEGRQMLMFLAPAKDK